MFHFTTVVRNNVLGFVVASLTGLLWAFALIIETRGNSATKHDIWAKQKFNLF